MTWSRFGDLYGCSSPISPAWDCGSSVPPYQTSACGFFFSASTFASVLPEPLRMNAVFTSYFSPKALVSASHISLVALQ
ncbi:Uncharacterised protein [Acinetobacter baumannii]|nr:Uncharacterised protein [Acinetobacter baumannii]